MQCEPKHNLHPTRTVLLQGRCQSTDVLRTGTSEDVRHAIGRHGTPDRGADNIHIRTSDWNRRDNQWISAAGHREQSRFGFEWAISCWAGTTFERHSNSLPSSMTSQRNWHQKYSAEQAARGASEQGVSKVLPPSRWISKEGLLHDHRWTQQRHPIYDFDVSLSLVFYISIC